MRYEKKATMMTTEELASYIDHSVLKPDFTVAQIQQHIQEGIAYKCKTVCINPSSLPIARKLCKDGQTGICVVCDFPFGTSTTESKIVQAEIICRDGDIEDLDIVANYGWICSGLYTDVQAEIAAIADVVHSYGTKLKVILETDALHLDQVARATDIACMAGSDFVKTSTGFYTGERNLGATTEVIKTMIQAAQGRCQVKGSGGIRTQEHFFELIDLGVDRMGIGFRSTPVVLAQKKDIQS